MERQVPQVDEAGNPIIATGLTTALHLGLVAFAVAARARHATLQVVHAWPPPYLDITGSEPVVRSIKNSARNLLQTAVQDPAVTGLQVESHMPSSGAAAALLSLANQASLIAVGSRGLGRFGRAFLGSTSRQLAHHAVCPVVVMPADD